MEPIAIVGIGCRFPQAQNPEAFWQLLRNGKSTIAEVPKDRWDIDRFYHPSADTPGKMNTRWGGFIEQVDRFDAEFFGISADEVEHSDPQQRLFLEVAWEALENASIVPTSLAGSQTGVFIGLCTVDYHRLLYKNFSQIGLYSGTGTTPCITANRLSYLLDLHGPSMAVDTACSSSLVTVHLACQSLRSRESNLCLAGGVNLILSPDSTISSSQTRLLSTEGRCKTFDASADGYVRGEGCGVIVLKRLSDAVKDGDNILALVRGSAVNQDGLSNSLTSPNGLAQQSVIRQALANGNVQPSEINYIDAHAVGTSIGDAIEFKALKAVLMEGRELNQPCLIGSVKTNIGHLEAAGGISALIKVVLSLQHEEIPPHLHLEQLNPYISLENTPISIPTELQPWYRGKRSRLAGVSAFGFGGTNAHVVLEEAPVNSTICRDTGDRPSHALALSAKSELALRSLAKRYEAYLATHPEASLADICYTANTGRTHFEHRVCIVAESIAQLRQQLSAFIALKETTGLFKGKVKGRKRPKIVFLFPNDDVSVPDLGWQLYQTQPTFRQEVDRCAAILQPDVETSFLEMLHPAISDRNDLAVFTVEYALAQLWQSWGIKPKTVMGYGVGEYVAACIAGVFSLEDAIALVAACTQLQAANLPEETKIEAFANVAKQVTYKLPQTPLISSLTGELIADEIANPEYWCKHLYQPGKITAETGDCLFLVLASLLPEMGDYLSNWGEQGDAWQAIGSSLGELFVRGAAIDWLSFDCNYIRRRLQLPTYPFQRQRYWFKTPENGHQEEIAWQQMSQTQYVNPQLTEEQHIAQLLKETGNFSEAQMKLVPELLEILAQQRRQLSS
ncbi:type I polyketide synthase [Aliterella atlantica]|uniref:type I polyketide synthase n=1 Tax=Aliterella atlantica TaxID=1827278 RepID=UPI0006961ABD|nr:type I polyketide synthase [Aliterella atlantica]